MNTKLLIVVTGQRHGSTTFCHRLSNFNHKRVCNGGEMFRRKAWYKLKADQKNTSEKYEAYLQGIIDRNCGNKTLLETGAICFKIFHTEGNLDLLLQTSFEKYIVFLQRNLEDSYASWVISMRSGNWATTPWLQESNKHLFPPRPGGIITFDEYKKNFDNWYNLAEQKAKEYNIKYNKVNFEDIIQKTYDYSINRFIFTE